MPKAEIVLPSGARVAIEGTDSEVRELLDHYATVADSAKKPAKRRRGGVAANGHSESAGGGPTGYVRQLKGEGFFGSKRTLGSVQERLAELGHIYPQTSLSPILIKLTKKRELRRMKERGAWVYVNP